MKGGAVGHNFERGPPKDHPSQIWLNMVRQFQRRRFKCDIYQNIENNYITEKPGIYVKLLLAMYLQLKFELILTCTKAAINN